MILLTYARPDSAANTPTKNTWLSITRGVRELSQNCVFRYGGGGLRLIRIGEDTIYPYPLLKWHD